MMCRVHPGTVPPRLTSRHFGWRGGVKNLSQLVKSLSAKRSMRRYLSLPFGQLKIRAGHLFDSRSGNFQNNQVVLITGDRITDVGSASAVQLPAGTRSAELIQHQLFGVEASMQLMQFFGARHIKPIDASAAMPSQEPEKSAEAVRRVLKPLIAITGATRSRTSSTLTR
jgi:hypothetical protein